MEELRTHLHTLFSWMPPELLLDSILRGGMERRAIPLAVDVSGPSMACYTHCARSHLRDLNEEELQQLYWHLQQQLKGKRGGVFSLLAAYGEAHLLFYSGEPLYRQRDALAWRDISHAAGQDLFTCGLLASRDHMENNTSTYFSWPAVIRTDDRALWGLFQRGISENHFHLNGSTQVFSLTWGFLMNHPDQADKFFSNGHFQENLKSTPNQGALDNARPWTERIYLAAWIRAVLFEALLSGNGTTISEDASSSSFRAFVGSLRQRRELMDRVETLRFSYGAKIPMPDGKSRCLDYAITPSIALENRGHYRFLAGERSFLYHCFQHCFAGRFSMEAQNLFYLYLLLRIQFRGELVQSNDHIGFHNFSRYQDRKDDGWSGRQEYQAESRNLSICGTISEGVQSLELRITPKPAKIPQIDKDVSFYQKLDHSPSSSDQPSAGNAASDGSPSHFYVIHFLKEPLPRLTPEDPWHPLEARNSQVRTAACRQAKLLAKSMKQHPALCERIRGIDAASYEIGCRPEVFATEFRFLRRFRSLPTQDGMPRCQPLLGATYHVGEDFLDIADGLRAIDEAIRFLCLGSGDRLGHALALGLDPECHYRQKSFSCILPSQDLLDDLVWLLFRCQELGLDIPPSLRSQMDQRAGVLLRELYGAACPNATLYDYYNSWMLRGDHPELYEDPTPAAVERAIQRNRSSLLNEVNSYPREKVLSWGKFGQQLEGVRKNPQAVALVHCYLYDRAARLAGQNPAPFSVEKPYLQLLRAVQDRMMTEIMDLGICIECNPTSNILISTFRQYDRHPIFRFNRYRLPPLSGASPAAHLRVSVNTDDQGVFDTSLKNEYALLMCCLQRQQDADGRRLLSDDEILDYLDHLRVMGNEMVFPPSRANTPFSNLQKPDASEKL